MGGHDSPEKIKQETRTYLMVFAALAVLTVVTVAVSYLDINQTQAVVVALAVATLKGGLVAAFFMHLISEEKLIYGILGLTMVFFVVMFVLTAGGYETGEHYVLDGAEAAATEEHH